MCSCEDCPCGSVSLDDRELVSDIYRRLAKLDSTIARIINILSMMNQLSQES